MQYLLSFYTYNNLNLIFAKKTLGRILAIDFGTKRTGIAVTDELQLIASGLTTVRTEELLDFLKEYLTNENVEALVIGEPKQMNNLPSESEEAINHFIATLNKELPDLKVIRFDERFTSKMAARTMVDSGLKKSKRRNKSLLDEISATIILQSYLSSIKM